ncbi:MAG: FAD-dependent oxidoreductase [Armatimonadetes bacterium]|nr:FAD-dependent oxidoreductase [Armatimonadota bacterium]
MSRFTYLIIGNSAGAVGCIEALREVDGTGTIALISDETRHVYSRALIPYYLEGKIERAGMDYRPPDFYTRHGVTPFLGKEAVGVDFDRKEVELAGGERIGYGKLLLATGGRPFLPPLPGLDRQNVFTFLSLDDVLAIEKALPGVKNAVVLGGGVIGLMAAEVLSKKGLDVCVLELAGRVLAPVVDETASALVEDLFRKNGVKIYTETTIKEIRGAESVEEVRLTDGRTIPAGLLIIAVGVVPRVELVKGTGIRVNRGIVVDQRMQTSVPDVYACGDCAEVYDFAAGHHKLLPLWPNAYAGGRIAGFNMAGRPRKYEWGTGMNATHFFDFYIINAGVNVTGDNADGYEIVSKLAEDRRSYRKFALKAGRIQGFVLAGEVARAGIFLHLMRKAVDVRAFQQELTKSNFGFSDLPDQLRWALLKDDVVLGVV